MLKVGSWVDERYQIVEILKEGGMSIIYLARQKNVGVLRVIKEMKRKGIRNIETAKRSIEEEKKILTSLDHPFLPKVIDVVPYEDSSLIIMEYVQGKNLAEVLKDDGVQTQNDVIQWAIDICEVLDYLHNRNPKIIHKDMKPSNIMLKDERTGKHDIKLIDFGASKEYEENTLDISDTVATPGYAAPEQRKRGSIVDERTDIYGLGATMYHLLTGVKPDKNGENIKNIKKDYPSLSEHLANIILKCVQDDPNNRYQSVKELEFALLHPPGKEKKHIILFCFSIVLMLFFGGIALWSNASMVNIKLQDYDYMLKNASDTEDYYSTILMAPEKTDAYFKFIDFLRADRLTKEETSQVIKLRSGINKRNSDGYSETVRVLEELKKDNPEGYEDVCYEIGNLFLFYLDSTNERERYINASEWYENAKEKYGIASVFCDIANCLDMIEQYHTAAFPQTDNEYKEYINLWNKLKKLGNEIDDFDNMVESSTVDMKINVIKSIAEILHNNAKVFLELSQKGSVDLEEINDLLNDIESKLNRIDNVIVDERKNEISKLILNTKNKYNSKK